ncbi:type II secretion system F family protein [Pseudalkalibacillus sp. R45]|uniref:type II secretion system F family protein n=1 Tax=Pseudalkalibacillus sp. R45 TaxID=3457433 RepID=UPI003FCCB6A5
MRRHKWNSTQQAVFLKNLGTLLDKGYSISESLTLLSLQNKRNASATIKTIKEDLVKGKPLFESLERAKNSFRYIRLPLFCF